WKKTGKPLVVPLTPPLIDLCKKLTAEHPEGPLFRTLRGRPWTSHAIKKRFRRWRRILIAEGHPMPDRIYAYCYRHQLATDLLARGESEALVAAIPGHKDTRMLHHHYSGVTARMKSVRGVLTRNVTLLPEEANVGAGGAGGPSGTSACGARPAEEG